MGFLHGLYQIHSLGPSTHWPHNKDRKSQATVFPLPCFFWLASEGKGFV